jgi:hypothetical protein
MISTGRRALVIEAGRKDNQNKTFIGRAGWDLRRERFGTALRSAEFVFAVEAYWADWSWMASWFTADTS